MLILKVICLWVMIQWFIMEVSRMVIQKTVYGLSLVLISISATIFITLQWLI